MTGNVTVRPYVPDDYAAVCALWRDAGWVGRIGSVLEEKRRARGGVFVAERSPDGSGAAIVGVAVWTEARGQAVVSQVAVAAALRRRGVAIALLREVERSAREHGFRRLALDCREDNTPAASLYRREGWTPDRARNWVRRRLRPVLVRMGLRRASSPFVETWSKTLPVAE